MFPLAYTPAGGRALLLGEFGEVREGAALRSATGSGTRLTEADRPAAARQVLDEAISAAVQRDGPSGSDPVKSPDMWSKDTVPKVLLDEVRDSDLLGVGSRGTADSSVHFSGWSVTTSCPRLAARLSSRAPRQGRIRGPAPQPALVRRRAAASSARHGG